MRISHIHHRIDQQQVYTTFLTSIKTQVVNIKHENLSRQGLTIWLDEVKTQWRYFSNNHAAISLAMRKISSYDEQELLNRSYFVNKTFDLTQQSYLDAIMVISSLIDKIADQNSSRSSSTVRSDNSSSVTLRCAQLPRLEIPKFNGTMSKWLSFKGLFSSFILNEPSLPPAIKLQYLKNSLTGPAAEILENTEIIDDNFQPAWEAVISRFENPRLLIHSSLLLLFSIKKMTKECSAELEKLYNTVTQEIRTLNMLKEPVQYWDTVLVFLVVQKLDPESVRAWEQELGSSKEPPAWIRLEKFIETRIQTLQAYERSQSSKSVTHPRSASARVYYAGHNNDACIEQLQCILCNQNHHLSRCFNYQQMTTNKRRDLIRRNNNCFNCLGKHRVARCPSIKRCLKCAQRHHTSLHITDIPSSKPSSKSDAIITDENSPKQVHHAHTLASTITLLPTIVVIVTNEHGIQVRARALLDQGSEISLVSENLVQLLNIPRRSCSLSLNTINDKTSKTRGIASLHLKPHFVSAFMLQVNAVILSKLTNLLPSENVDKSQFSHLNKLLLADPAYNKPGTVDIILGSDVYGELLQGPIVKGRSHSPFAQLTSFGWIISGPSTLDNHAPALNTHHYSIDDDLQRLLERFWKQEETPCASATLLTPEEKECEEHFKNTHQRDGIGRYIVKLPFKQNKNQFGNSLPSAMRMLQTVQQKFKINPDFHQAYQRFLYEYEQLGHMIQVTSPNQSPKSYLPHHGVVRNNKSSTKLRVVFNGSCRTSNGVPLNQMLHTGEKLQTDLIDVLMRFRLFKYVFSSDIEKMYRQINVHQDDWKYQTILWNKGDQISKFQLTTVTYGLACAPFLALRSLKQLIEDEGTKFPLAVETLSKGRYVDDVFGGAHSLEEAKQTAHQVNQLCLAGQFPLKKWISNKKEILNLIPDEHKLASSMVQVNNDSVLTLGISWNSSNDSFRFNMPSHNRDMTKITKRTVLSKIAQFFDPLGWLSPVFIRFKTFMQELWTIKLSWDDQLAPQQLRTWQHLLDSLSDITKINIPRWIGYSNREHIEIHGFCDASQAAMAAVVYLRIRTNRHISTSLLCSKTKVAPLKRMTIPRLELSAAVILTKLVAYCINILKFENIPCYMWTDSSVVYAWINEHPSKWKEFVNNRVCLIQDTLPKATWKHVPGKENPADCATRGLTANELKDYNIWWSGPSWLLQDRSNWPSTPPQRIVCPEVLESRPKNVHTTQITSNDFLNRFSSLRSLVRMSAICKRVFRRLRGDKEATMEKPITPEELQAAIILWIKYTQKLHFKTEIHYLNSNQQLPKSNPIVRLMPFIDNQGVLRVGGRLKNSILPFSSRHPCIIPKNSSLTTLLIRDAHEKILHGSTQTTLTHIRTKYWIIGGRNPVRSIILKCVKCTRYRRSQAQQLMGQLPATRVTPARAFLHTGIDYAGPFMLKAWRGRCNKIQKSWIALFICYTTSAIHLEVVSDYSTDAFLAAYRRFTARRGICSTLNSDCGTNFKGANKELTKLFSSASVELKCLAGTIAHDGTKWIFNPPAAPNFGGKWEAGVKSMKHHLRRVVGDTMLTFEEMTTLLTQIEAVLNSRPLCPLSNDPDDLEVLTPGHFLIGHPITMIPEPNLENRNIGRLSRWQQLTHMTQSFWQKWTREYLQRYQAVYKWTSPSVPVLVGSLAIIMDERYPPSKWPLGRVTEVHPGKDGITRVATLKTKANVITRPITKLCILPIDSIESNSSLCESAKAGGNV